MNSPVDAVHPMQASPPICELLPAGLAC